MSGTLEGRVLQVLAGSYRVETPGGERGCVLGGRLKQGGGDRVTVGDRVRIEPLPEGPDRIVAVLPRRSKLARRSVARGSEQVIVANVDRLAAVFAVRRPEPDRGMLDRLLLLAELNGLGAFVVANKADLLEPSPAGSGDGAGLGTPGPLPPVFRPYREAGYPVLLTSVPERRGLARLREALRAHTTALAGPSGAGKSSLLNALVPGLDRRIGALSAGADRGRHTTVNASLVRLPDGGYVADTPGLQYLALSELPPDEIAAGFPELRPLLDACRFNDCRHLEEPGCAVTAALERGEIPAARYESYRALAREAAERAREW